MDNEQLFNLVQSEYPGAKPEIMSENGKDLETVKVFFESDAQLGEASLHGLLLGDYSFRAPV